MTKTELSPQEDNQEIKIKNKGLNLFFIEKVGFLFILLSGLMPFVHSFVKDETPENKIFGFTGIQAFLYSLGVHLSILFLVIGILLIISVVNSPARYKIVQNYLRYSLISPFISSIFYLSWVFIPDVDYNLLAYIFLSLFICFISLIIFYQILRYINALKVDYKNQLIQIKNTISKIKINFDQSKLPEGIANNILCNLNDFENSKRFTNKSVNLNYLANELKTNSKYLSKTINIYKKKTFTQYINDLRIEYLIEKLNTDKTFKNYTIQAIATEIGFNTSNAFSRAFFKKTGMYPSEYIKELDS
ncbi:helix-turn-helix domain-containing protein [Aquimarina muelleri]|uniref:HTH araC/xylS-type domain-containing protein n=1 Tax=Aquimarina muelleri TaxID=279356 RepID=A0A918JTD5_9FLAO|nr:helix-turn-helix domain-containing protein [Aquimarina muelleri]MCX2763938.1 helix-turn-helix domain-containing protein [Aquimarina muelleri]GGX11235.1 hypothetical protein GCM10007384_11310 [Aquimarina muelleri]